MWKNVIFVFFVIFFKKFWSKITQKWVKKPRKIVNLLRGFFILGVSWAGLPETSKKWPNKQKSSFQKFKIEILKTKWADFRFWQNRDFLCAHPALTLRMCPKTRFLAKNGHFWGFLGSGGSRAKMGFLGARQPFLTLFFGLIRENDPISPDPGYAILGVRPGFCRTSQKWPKMAKMAKNGHFRQNRDFGVPRVVPYLNYPGFLTFLQKWPKSSFLTPGARFSGNFG